MGRLVWYAGVSAALAGGVVISAFNNRANFYSACVYLSQSNLCLMILINLILFIYGSFMYGLQRLCYGALRPIETEQIYEKGWFAVTETCLAMTIFREEVGAWFLVMFVALLTGKVWGWIGDGRVEILEQQPPSNPRLFHMRLSISLTMSVVYDLWLMNYCINTVIQQARPNMMVMFLFEFAILTTSSFATACRYAISLIEAKVVKTQTQERLMERRREVREERAELIRQREVAASAATDSNPAPEASTPLPSEEDVDEMDIEVPGWEAKGQWVLTLDLVTDFLKLGIYVTFFIILLMFYGIPIHIIRDLFITARSFTKRLAAFLRYRRATRDMNERYPDASAEDIQREDTCIICREEMRPWVVTNPQAPPAAPGAMPPARPGATVNERTRPKKLPCGHILHLGCLKSWLERQQVCPTCRAPVVSSPAGQPPRAAANNAAGQGPQPPLPGQQDGAGRPPGRGMRMLNLGPLRLGFGQGNLNDMAQELGGQPGQENGGAGPRVYGLELGFPGRRAQPQAQPAAASGSAGSATIQEQLQQIEQEIAADIRNLQTTQQELQLVQLLQAELARLRLVQNGGPDPSATNFQLPPMPTLGPMGGGRPTMPAFPAAVPQPVPQMQRHGVRSGTVAIPSGSSELPPGVTIPEGWSLLPLQRLDGPAASIAQTTLSGQPLVSTMDARASAATTRPGNSPMPATSASSTLAPTIVQNQENVSQTSSTDSYDSHAVHTPSSAAADQSHLQASTTGMPSSSTTTSSSVNRPSSTQDASLPNWAGSQAFTAPELSATVADTSADPSTAAEEQAGASSTEEHDDAQGEQEKGKGKAVTVEDAEDPEM